MSPHYVYRCYAADGRLLYVGCTRDVDVRVRQHRRKTRWFASEVARVEREMFPTRDLALAKEKDAIVRERPERNVVYRNWSLRQTEYFVREAQQRAYDPSNTTT